ncbi:MAG: S9 family peptidase [Candidatus Eisenbacteria bacterium]|nr:S9 family peptidase [Candidatus Eisenbacteria bacterium]
MFAALGVASAAGRSAGQAAAPEPPDAYLWLEDVDSETSLQWARARNDESSRALTNDPEFASLRARLLAIYDSKDRIAYPDKVGDYLYNFWTDETHVRGILRRTSMESFLSPTPSWETVIDLDSLAADEKENWVYGGYDVLEPDRDRCLIRLSRGGGDAAVVREFDLATKTFVSEGFSLPEAKSFTSWKSRDTLYVGTDFGPGSLTDAGYPRLVKEWARGTPIAAARTIYEGVAADPYNYAYRVLERGGRVYDFLIHAMSAYANETFLRRGAEWVRLDKQDDAEVRTFADQILLTLRSDWTTGGRTYPAGSLLAIQIERFLAGGRDFAVLFEPGARRSLAGVGGTLHHLIINEMENVRDRHYTLTPQDGSWMRKPVEGTTLATVAVWGVDPLRSDDYWMHVTDFLTPTTLSLGTIGAGPPAKVRSLPSFFDAGGLSVEQLEAVSADGTRVPYFLVARAGIPRDGSNPTLLYGYGGFEQSMQPFYGGSLGVGWLERGGVYALANTRGGGEFGPQWHQAAIKENRQRAFDDFIAVAEDLIATKVTSPAKLGIEGGSNGGLLVGVVLVQRPELFGAVVSQVPLLDMRRYHKLLAGASWMGEYGDPDAPEEWAYLSKYSPYHNVRADAHYPPVLFTTSTRDDRVHPGHARKMVARMLEQGHRALYYENIEGGHATASNNPQRAFMTALEYSFLQKELGLR